MNNNIGKDWNPDLYLKFNDERTQPSIDLVSRIKIKNPKKIIDIGCGPGNSTQILSQKWPQSKIFGIDSSPAMIEKARKDFPSQDWKIIDAQDISVEDKYDLVFSNATIQWIPEHKKLIPNLFYIVEKGGALAVQMPLYYDMPASEAVKSVATDSRWKKIMEGIEDELTFNTAGFYFDVLSEFTNDIDIWDTSYFHIMENHTAIFEMLRSTGMKTYLARLENESDKINFINEIINEIVKLYPVQINGKVLFPFKRLFFIAYK